ncbi:uncharacterized protein G2W53_006569 [Senna tora]|uniref:Uncharacterized protein n=1 Tax=Senna tora TaxID=362788 RepID=A0A834X482_9FABA|nr:uncharacterized protein G2W53_006569 [Senna tora]
MHGRSRVGRMQPLREKESSLSLNSESERDCDTNVLIDSDVIEAACKCGSAALVERGTGEFSSYSILLCDWNNCSSPSSSDEKTTHLENPISCTARLARYAMDTEQSFQRKQRWWEGTKNKFTKLKEEESQ